MELEIGDLGFAGKGEERQRTRVRVLKKRGELGLGAWEETYPDGWEGEGERWAAEGGAMADTTRRKRLLQLRPLEERRVDN